MKRLCMRLLALAMAVCICSVCSINTFAMAYDSYSYVPEELSGAEISTYSAGNLLYAPSKTIETTATITVNMESANWDANFYVGVLGNAGNLYNVYMTAPNGNSYEALVTGNEDFINIANMLYAKAGTYTFKFTNVGSSPASATAMVWIYD